MDQTAEQVIAENKKLREDNAALTQQIETMKADILVLKHSVFQILDMFGLLNETKTEINEKYWPKDGSDGENPLPDVVASFLDLGMSYAQTRNPLKRKSERLQLDLELKQRFSFIWDIKDIYNRLSIYHGGKILVLEEKPDTNLKKV